MGVRHLVCGWWVTLLLCFSTGAATAAGLGAPHRKDSRPDLPGKHLLLTPETYLGLVLGPHQPFIFTD